MERIKCLLIEDDDDDRFILLRAISQLFENVFVRSAYDAEEAFDILWKENFTPDIIILDLNLPKLNGIECLEKIRMNEGTKDVSVVVLSTSVEGIDFTTHKSLKIHKVIKKPSSFDDVLIEVNTIFSDI